MLELELDRVAAILPKQFDAWIWFDETAAVAPLPGEQRPGEEETYPLGSERA